MEGAIQPLAGNVTEYLETKISVKVVCLGRGKGRGGERRETFGKHHAFLELNPRALCSLVYTTSQ